MKRSHFASFGLLAGIAIVIALVVYSSVRNQPDRVFMDMLRSNLSTSGVTRIITQQGQGLNVTQYNQLSLGAQPVAHALTVFKQNGGTLATEEISNQSSDYVRYQAINTTRKDANGKPLDVSQLVGKWARLETGSSLGNSLASGLFNQSLSGVLPVANLTSTDREKLMNTIQATKLFSYQSKDVKTTVINGQKAYEFDVAIQPGAYVTVMQQYGKLVGLHTYDTISPGVYAHAQPISLKLYVNAVSHQLMQTYQASTGRTEKYEGWGLSEASPPPKATLTASQLAARLAALGQ